MKKKLITSLNTAIKVVAITIMLLLIIFGILFYMYHRYITPATNIQSTNNITTIYENTKDSVPTYSNTDYKVLSTSLLHPPIIGDNRFVTSSNELNNYLSTCLGLTDKISQYFDDTFFENYNLAIEMHYDNPSNHIVSVTQNNSVGTINIAEDYCKYDNYYLSDIKSNFIILDKNIKSVNFNIYRTSTVAVSSNSSIMAIAFIVITISIITIVCMLLLGKKSKKQTVFIILLIVIVLLFVIIFFKASIAKPYIPRIEVEPTNFEIK